jgi:hypothetical protein
MGSADAVTLPADNLVFQFRKQVKAENTHRITVDAGELTVFRNKSAYESNETHMEEDAAVSGLGDSKQNALVVVVPNSKLKGISVGVNGRNSNVFGYFRRNHNICQET